MANLVALLEDILSSSTISVTVTEPVPDRVLNSTPTASIVPSTLTFDAARSIYGEVICISVFALRSNVPSVEEFINISASLN